MTAKALAVESYRNFIGGVWEGAASGETFESRNPARTSEVLGRFAASGAAEVGNAVNAAAAAFPAWRDAAPATRANILHATATWLEERAATLGDELSREEGKTIAEARSEVLRTAEHFRFYAALAYLANGQTFPSGDPRLQLFTRRVPLGVVAVVAPWNFPLSIPGRKIAPALASGNTVVFKPASETPLLAVRLVEALEAAGLPPGVCNLVTGRAGVVGDPLVMHPAIAAVTFTGSTEIGFHIQRSVGPVVRTQLEMGGKNALVVLADADLPRAVRHAVSGGLHLTGQACTGTSRIFVERGVYARFVELLVEAASRLVIGPGTNPATTLGPLVNEGQERRFLSFVDAGVREGARLRHGGAKLRGPLYDEGYFVEPAIFDNVDPQARIAREEVFGPLIGVTPFDDLDEAIALVNESDYGLAASICTTDLVRAMRFVEAAEVGMVKVNRPTTGVAMNAPFGGWKHSSTATFREEGTEAIDFFTKTKTVFLGAD